MAVSLATLLLLLLSIGVHRNNFVEGCSCMAVHPQEHFCTSDFVIVARVKKNITQEFLTTYKVNIKKEFKMTEKAKVALKSGKIITAAHDAMCGVYLEVAKVYIITGRILGLQAHINMCGYHNIWKNLTKRQRKGFRLIYGRGCNCKISSHAYLTTPKDTCPWSDYKCYNDHGICLKSPRGQCNWTKSLELKKCLDHTPHNRDSRRRLQQPTNTTNIEPKPTNLEPYPIDLHQKQTNLDLILQQKPSDFDHDARKLNLKSQKFDEIGLKPKNVNQNPVQYDLKPNQFDLKPSQFDSKPISKHEIEFNAKKNHFRRIIDTEKIVTDRRHLPGWDKIRDHFSFRKNNNFRTEMHDVRTTDNDFRNHNYNFKGSSPSLEPYKADKIDAKTETRTEMNLQSEIIKEYFIPHKTFTNFRPDHRRIN